MKTRILQIKCPNCGSKIHATNEIGEYKCPYCDSSFLIESRGRNITKLGLAALDTVKEINENKIQQKRWEEEQKRKEKRNKLIGGFALLAISFVLLFTMKSPEKTNDLTNSNDIQNDTVATEEVKEPETQKTKEININEEVDDEATDEETITEQEVDDEVESEDPSLILITEDNLEDAAVGNRVLLTGVGDVYRVSNGRIYINDFFSHCGVSIDVDSSKGTRFKIEADDADPGDFESVFRAYPRELLVVQL